MTRKKVIVSGAAGFIGYHLCKALIKQGDEVIGFDNLNNYYDVNLKKNRIKDLDIISNNTNNPWIFEIGDLEDNQFLEKLFCNSNAKIVINLAAQAGVRYSLENPRAYINSNIIGFFNILECCKKFNIKNFLYASSSSVYGGNEKIPFSENDPVNHPISIYAATKRSNELMAHTYSHLYSLSSTGLRFFTVYGPYGRPDMAPMIFAKAIFSGKKINVYNEGNMSRDFTFVDDIVNTINKLIENPAEPNKSFDKKKPVPSTSWAPHRILNIGNNDPVSLSLFIRTLEQEIGIKAIKNYEKMQPGDVQNTFADTNLLELINEEKIHTSLSYGIKQFIDWYKKYYNIKI